MLLSLPWLRDNFFSPKHCILIKMPNNITPHSPKPTISGVRARAYILSQPYYLPLYHTTTLSNNTPALDKDQNKTY